MNNHSIDELLAAANPIPDTAQLEDEAFSIEDVMGRLDGALAPASDYTATHHRRRRSLAVAATAFAFVLAVGAASALILRGEAPTASDSDLGNTGDGTDTSYRDDYFGSSSYNPFVGIRQSLVSQSDFAVFSAQVAGEVAATDMYFRLVTLETYDGTQFYANRPATRPVDNEPWVDPLHQWVGPTTTVTVDIEIDRLRMDWLPAPATATRWRADDGSGGTVRVRGEDGTLRLDPGLTYSGMRYSVDAEVPQLDLTTLVGDADGSLTTLFAAVAADGGAVPDPQARSPHRTLAVEHERHTSLPSDAVHRTEELRALAAAATDGAESAFERGLYLEAWFHSEAFGYSVDVEPGVDIETWLLEPRSATYHLGYAEQYSTAMAILARTLDIPSRVVLGFVPGDPTDDDAVAIQDRHAHAWVELWIPQHGWTRFDPTPRSDGAAIPTHKSVGEQLGLDLTDYLVP